MDFIARQKNLRLSLQSSKADALVVTHLPNIRYLCGFTGSAGVLLASATRRPVLFVDGRYTAQARQQTSGVRVVTSKGSALLGAAEACSKATLRRIGLESDHLTVASLGLLEAAASKSTRLVRLSGVIEGLRAVKEPAEIECIRRAVSLSSGLFRPLTRSLRPGVTELSVAARLEYAARRAGAEGMSFETIVASGERSALPHGVASAAALPSSGFVVLDYGVVVDGYCSDMTRTVHLGKAPMRRRDVYNAVLEAQLAAISAVRGGIQTGEVDRAAREVLRRHKLDRYFVHSTGHGVGLEIHELPRLGKGGKAILESGMVVTIEPGVYLPGEGGVRIEDMLVVTEGGCKLLTPVPKTLLELS